MLSIYFGDKEAAYGPTWFYLASDKAKASKGRSVLDGRARVADRNERAIPADFTIAVFEPNCQGMDDGHVVRIIFHELLHVGIGEDKGGNESCLVLPHDLEDFRACVDWRGIDWHGRASTMGDREPRDGGGDAREGLPDEEPSRRSLGGGDDWAMRTSR